MGIYGTYAHRLMGNQNLNEGFFDKFKKKATTTKKEVKETPVPEEIKQEAQKALDLIVKAEKNFVKSNKSKIQKAYEEYKKECYDEGIPDFGELEIENIHVKDNKIFANYYMSGFDQSQYFFFDELYKKVAKNSDIKNLPHFESIEFADDAPGFTITFKFE